jgi:hypothetical protein
VIDEATFRQNFLEFSNTAVFTPGAVAFWIGVATMVLPTQTWGLGSTVAQAPVTTPLDIGLSLFVAHQLSLEARAVKQAANGGIPGSGPGGPVSSESVGGVSRSYDTSAGLNLDAGPWNLTNYGTRFVFLARLMGKGPLQFGVDLFACGVGIGAFSFGAWPGPPVGPWGPNGF